MIFVSCVNFACMFKACCPFSRAKHHDVFEECLDYGQTPKRRGRKPQAQWQETSRVERLARTLDERPDVPVDAYRDSSGRTLLIVAAMAGDEAVVAYLLERGCDPNETDTRGWTALHCASAYCKSQVCMLLLEQENIDVERVHNGGATALTVAAHAGLATVVERLIARGADVQWKNVMGLSPLIMAIDGGNPAIAKMLISAGCAVDDSDNVVGLTALHLATFLADDDTIELILKKLDLEPERKRQCINLRTKFGLTCLHRAVANGHLSTVRILLAHGADPNVREGRKRAVSIMKSMGKAAMAQGDAGSQQPPGFQSILVSHFVNRSPHDSLDTMGEGATPLHYSARAGDSQMVKLLLASGADPRLAMGRSKLSAVDVALKHDAHAAIRAFREHFEKEGVDVTEKQHYFDSLPRK